MEISSQKKNGNFREVTSEIRQGRECVLIWNVRGWREEPGVLKHSSCLMDIGNNPTREGSGSRGQLTFSFGERVEISDEFDNVTGEKNEVQTRILMLHCKETKNKVSCILQYDIRVEVVDSKGDVMSDIEGGSISHAIGDKKGEKMKLEGAFDFIKLERFIADEETGKLTTAKLPQPDELRLKISVTPTYLAEQVHDSEEQREEEASLCQALKRMFASEESYSDLKLGMKDNVTLSAHKFILAARSPVLRARIQEAVKGDDVEGEEILLFSDSGTIKLKDVNAMPMVAILHWMYTGELHENAGKCMEEVVDAAIKFQLADLIKILDKKVISICNEENMFQLYRTAKKNGMLTAEADIAKYIRANV